MPVWKNKCWPNVLFAYLRPLVCPGLCIFLAMRFYILFLLTYYDKRNSKIEDNSLFFTSHYKYIPKSEVAQSCPTLHDRMDCNLPGSSVHGIFQARVLEWVAISFSRGYSWPWDQTRVPRVIDRRFTVWATREVPYTQKEEPKSVHYMCAKRL